MKPNPAEASGVEAVLQRVLENVAAVAYGIDAAGRMEWVQGPIDRVTGFAAEEVIGREAWLFVAPDRRAFSEDQLRRQLAGELGTVAYTIPVETASGSTLVLHTVHAPRRVRGAVVGVDGLAYSVVAEADLSVPVPNLTPRQLDVLRLLAEGLGTKEIAQRLDISPETARNHIRAVMSRFRCRTRLATVLAARAQGIV